MNLLDFFGWEAYFARLENGTMHPLIDDIRMHTDGAGEWSLHLTDGSGTIGIRITAHDLMIDKPGEFTDTIAWQDLVDLLSDINAEAAVSQAAIDAARLELIYQLAGSCGVDVAT